MITVNALKVRTKLGGILDNVAKGETYVIEKLGKPAAVVIPYNKHIIENQEKAERQKRIDRAIKSIDVWRERYGKKYAQPDSAEIVRKMRDERAKHLLDVVEGRQ